MSLATLRAFHAVASEGSIQKASEALGLTQPAISIHLKKLKDESQVPLFRRSGHRLELSAEGQKLYKATDQMLRAQREANEVLHPSSSTSRTKLVIGADGPYVVTDIIKAFQARRPNTEISVILNNAAGIWDALFDLKVDLVVLAGAPSDKRVVRNTLVWQDVVAVIPLDHKLAAREFVTLADLADEPLIFREAGSSTQKQVDIFFHSETRAPVSILTMGSREAVLTAVAKGLGIGFAYSREVVQKDQFAVIPIQNFENASCDEVICLNSNRHSSDIQEFLNCCADYKSEHENEIS